MSEPQKTVDAELDSSAAIQTASAGGTTMLPGQAGARPPGTVVMDGVSEAADTQHLTPPAPVSGATVDDLGTIVLPADGAPPPPGTVVMEGGAGAGARQPPTLTAAARGATAEDPGTIVLAADASAQPPGTVVMDPASRAGVDDVGTIVLAGESGGGVAPPAGTIAMGPMEGAPATQVIDSQADSARTIAVDQSLGDLRASQEISAVTIQGYQVVGELGRGGMGVVYRARQIGLNRTVALKMIIAGAHAGNIQLARFRAEAEAVARMQHPNIVQIYDIGEQDGLPYFSLEYVDGKPLDKDLDGKPQPEKRAAALMETLARAMHYAHEHDIIHRDLKPANVLLTKKGVPKISDFGLAKQMDSESSQTKTGTVMGTPSYMAPEQGRGEKQIGHLADVYALGSMLYEMITGRPPFLAETVLKTLMRLLHEEPVPPSRIQPDVSRDLETICMKCLQKDPARRYASAADLADDLRRFQNGEPILARPVGRAARAWRWCKRNPRLAVLYGTVSVLVIAVAATAWSIVSRVNRDRAAIAETRKQAEQRLEQATEAVASGSFSRAQDLLRWTDPILSTTDELAETRRRLGELSTQIAAYADFRQLLDKIHYLGLFGGTPALPKAREASHELIALYDRIEQRQDAGRHGWPPLDKQHQELLQEDIFEAFLVSSQIERSASLTTKDEATIAEATRLSIQWLNRVENTLPPTKAFFVWRGGYHDILGEKEAAKADFDRAGAIEATSAVDRFWHAFADYRRAEEALQRGDNRSAGSFYRQAATGFAKVIEVRPENFWAHFSWATCLPRLGDGYGALVGYSNCIQIRPDVPWPYLNRGTIHFQLREFDQAIADFDKAVAMSPEDPQGYVKRGTYHYTMKGFAKAKADFTDALRLQPADTEARRNRAVLSLLGRDPEGSLADWKELSKLQPQNHEPHYYIGAIYLGQQNFDAALAELEMSLALKANDESSLLARAMIRRWQDRADEALKDINFVNDSLAPNRGDYLIERADLLRALGRDAEAIEEYQRCLTLQPKQIDGYLGLAALYAKRASPVLARECYERMVKADPGATAPYLRRAEFRRQLGEFDAALADCAEGESRDASSIEPGLVRAGITAARGDHAKAAGEIEALLAKAKPSDGATLYALACAWSLAADAARARPDDAEAAARAAEYSDRAVASLVRVLGEGFHDLQYPGHNRMAWDPALEGIRGLPEVRRMLAGRK